MGIANFYYVAVAVEKLLPICDTCTVGAKLWAGVARRLGCWDGMNSAALGVKGALVGTKLLPGVNSLEASASLGSC